VAASLKAMQEVKSFHFEMDARIKLPAQQSGGLVTEIPLKMVGDFVAPDRMRGKMTMSLGFISVDIESIAIGDKVYITNPQTGQWELAGGQTFALPSPQDFTGVDASQLGNLSVVGEVTLDGTKVLHLRGKLPLDVTGQTGGEAQAEYWIGAEDRLIRQISVEGDVPLDDIAGLPASPLGGAGASGNAQLSLLMKFSRYGESITIEAPIP
jgi:hypothetical protein